MSFKDFVITVTVFFCGYSIGRKMQEKEDLLALFGLRRK